MARRPKTICKHAGCNTLVAAPGYCSRHAKTNRPFAALNARKTTASKKFYSSAAWTAKSKQHRVSEPLCQQCLGRGRVALAQMVHHKSDLSFLLAKGLDPLDDKYLESLCNNCHLVHLRAKKSKRP